MIVEELLKPIYPLNSWTKEFEASPDTYVYLSAQAENEDANITVTIYYEGDTFKESSSSGVL